MTETRPRRFRTADGAAKALAQTMGVEGFPGGYLGVPGTVDPDLARAVADGLGVHVARYTGYWRLVDRNGHPHRGWAALCRHIANRGLVEPDAEKMKGWKWRDAP